MLPRILIVDDDPACLLALSEALQLRFPYGAAIETALSVDDGLQLLSEYEYDVVICDVRLPGKDGITFLRESRARRPDVPVVLMTAAGTEQEEEALYGGAYAFIEKPIRIDRFVSVLQDALGWLASRPPQFGSRLGRELHDEPVDDRR